MKREVKVEKNGFMPGILYLTPLITGILLSASCLELDREPPATLFGLPHIAIEMRESDFTNLLKNALVNEYAAITIQKNGVKKSGKIRRRGHSSRYFYKPSFNIDTDDGRWHYVAANIDKSYCREIFANLIFENSGFLTPKMEFVALSVNNVYQGLYIAREPIDENFFRRRNIEINSLYEMRNHGKFTFNDGGNSAMYFEKIFPRGSRNYNDMNILISALDESDTAKINSILWVEQAAKYSAVSSVINNFDGIRKNLHICNTKYNGEKNRENKFLIIPYDLDLTFGQTIEHGFTIPTRIPTFQNGLFERLDELYKTPTRTDLIEHTLNIIDENISTLDYWKNKISQAYQNDPYLKGEDLDRNIAKIKEYVSVMRSLPISPEPASANSSGHHLP